MVQCSPTLPLSGWVGGRERDGEWSVSGKEMHFDSSWRWKTCNMEIETACFKISEFQVACVILGDIPKGN